MLKSENGSEIKRKIIGFSIQEAKECKINGADIGVIKGFASTYNNIDRGGDVIRPGAFTQSLKRHQDDDRQVRMFFQHDQLFPIGGFPISQIVDNEKGLFVVGNINLKADKGLSTYELIKQGVITDMSIGYSVNKAFTDDEGNFNLTDIELWEISAVTEPMNPEANILEVKGATTFKDLPLADRTRPWSSDAAIARVRDFTGSTESASRTYRNAFFWFDGDSPENLTSYKLPFVDIIDGRMVAVPRGIFAAAAAMSGARGGVDLPAADRPRVETHINRYYDKMGLESPLKSKSMQEMYKIFYGASDEVAEKPEAEKIENVRDAEKFLKEKCSLSSLERKTLISKLKSLGRDASSEAKQDDKRDAAIDVYEQLKDTEVLMKLNKINCLLKGE